MSEQEWNPMNTAPKNCEWVELKHKRTGEVSRAHFAEDFSGECQPAFTGWFIEAGKSGFIHIGFDEDFTGWRAAQ
jgi:hypothetical protein